VIKNLRGIREGQLEGLTPLVVLVGPNGSGKSTVLDALWIGASATPGRTVGEVVARRGTHDLGPRWLLWKLGELGPARIAIVPGGRSRVLSWKAIDSKSLIDYLRKNDCSEPFMGIECSSDEVGIKQVATTAFVSDEQFGISATGSDPLPSIAPDVRFLDPSRATVPLHQLYSDAVIAGRRQDALELVRAVVPGISNLEILTHPNPALHMVFPDGSVPVALAGDGIQALVRLTLEAVTRSKGLVLIEEPEVHQHPAALRQSAKAIVASVRRGTQVILSTHSLELIDALLAEATPEDLKLFSTYRLRLQQGKLETSRLTGEEMAFSRGQIEDDLR